MFSFSFCVSGVRDFEPFEYQLVQEIEITESFYVV